MNIRRKGLRAAVIASLLSSLLATAAAPTVLGAVTWTDTTSVPVNGTGDNASLQLTENSAPCFAVGANPNAIRITIFDSADGPTLSFADAGVASGPGSLGVTTSLSSSGGGTNNRLNISFGGSDPFNIEQINITSLEIFDPAGAPAAAAGAIKAFMTGPESGCVGPATGSATGTLVTSMDAGIDFNEDVILTGNCLFAVTGGLNTKATFSGADPRDITDAGVFVDNNANGYPDSGDLQDNIDFGAGIVGHGAGVAVEQTVSSGNCNNLIASPGAVVNAINLTASTATFVLPGENNQAGGTATWTETGATTIGTQTLTFTLGPAGVRFSSPPTVTPTGGVNLGAGAGAAVPCALNVVRSMCTVTSTGDAAGPDSVALSGVLLDVDATVPLGVPVTVALTTSGGTVIGGGPATIAIVARVIVATAAQPTILIGVNDQESGLITLAESMPGYFTGGLGANNTFGICIATGETLTRAPWAVVTTGNLLLLSGFVGATQVKGTLFTGTGGRSCAYWTVFSATTGTTPSVVEIRGSANDTSPLPSGANNGPRLSVPSTLAPGSTQTRVLVGTQPLVTGDSNTVVRGLVSNAIRAFRSGPVVAAVSQPLIAPGTTDGLGGNITVTEQFNGQLKAGQVLTFRILPRATVARQDVILQTGVTNGLPIVSTNAASGLLVTPVSVLCPPSALLGIVLCTFTFGVSQQSFGPTLGQITVSNIHYIVAADAVNGPVLVNVTAPGAGSGGPAGSQAFDAVVSNATVGNPPPAPARTSIGNGSLAGVVKVSQGATFTASTKVVAAGGYVTWQAEMDPAASGERVGVWIAKRANSSSVWSAFTQFSTRAVNSNGLTVFHYDNGDVPGWVSVKFSFAGNASHGPATSLARQARYV